MTTWIMIWLVLQIPLAMFVGSFIRVGNPLGDHYGAPEPKSNNDASLIGNLFRARAQ